MQPFRIIKIKSAVLFKFQYSILKFSLLYLKKYNIYLFNLANAINDYQRLKIHVVLYKILLRHLQSKNNF